MIKSDKVNVIYDNDVVLKNKELIRALGNKFLIVCGKNSARLSSALDDVLEAIKGKDYVIYDKIRENPEVSSILEASKLLEGINCVIGIGGGSALDAAKVIACLPRNKAESEEELYAQKWENKGLPLILIGTTAGTGSEVTKVAVLSKANGRKSSIHNDKFYAVFALCDPKYTSSMPKMIAASTAVDALTHCNESYFSNKATDQSREYAIEGIKLLLSGLKSINDPNERSRDELYKGSLYGGLAIDITGTTFAHNVGYYLTEQYHIPHGFACAIFQEDLFDFEMENNKEYTEEFFKKIGISKDDYVKLINSLIPEYDISLDEATLEEILPRWSDNGSVKNTYGQMTCADVEKILRKKFCNKTESVARSTTHDKNLWKL